MDQGGLLTLLTLPRCKSLAELHIKCSSLMSSESLIKLGYTVLEWVASLEPWAMLELQVLPISSPHPPCGMPNEDLAVLCKMYIGLGHYIVDQGSNG